MDELTAEVGTEDGGALQYLDGNEMAELFSRMHNADYRDAVRLTDYEGYSVKEAAEIMGKTSDAVYHYKERGQKEAARILVDELGYPPPSNYRAKQCKNKA